MIRTKASLPRVAYLRDRYADALQERVGLHMTTHPRVLARPHGAFDYALAIDPTPKAKYLQTIIKWILGGSILLEDGRMARNALGMFDAVKHKLPLEHRDVNGFDGLRDLIEMVAPLHRRIARLAVPEHIARITPIVASGNEWSIHRVDSTEAATWWADSTHWCTRHPDTAKRYLDKGPLHVLVAGHARYQFHGPSKQFMDENDRVVRLLPDGVPVEAIEALLETMAHPGDSGFFEVRAMLDLWGMLDEHDGGRRFADLPDEVRVWNDAKGKAWMNNEQDLMIVEDQNPAFGSISCIVVRKQADGRWSTTRLADEDAWNEMEQPDSVLLSLIRWGLRRNHAIKRIPQGSWVDEMPECTTISNRLRVLVGRGGKPSIMLHGSVADDGGKNRRTPLMLHMVDCRARPGKRVRRLHGIDDLHAAPVAFRSAISDFQKQGRVYGPFEIFGRHAIIESTGAEWRNNDLRRLAIDMGLSLEWKSGQPIYPGWYDPGIQPWTGNLEELVELVFEDLDHRTLWEMMRCLGSTKKWRYSLLVPDRGRIEGAVEALLSIKDVPGAGHLLAAVADEDCTDDLVDELLAAGRMETLSVMPARMFVDARLALCTAPFKETGFNKHIAARTLDPDLLQRLKPARAAARLETTLGDLFQKKGYTWIAALLDRMDRADKNWYKAKLHSSQNDTIAILLEDDRISSEIERAFEHVPTLGLPWQLVLRRLASSSMDMGIVLEGVGRNHWSDVRSSKCFSDLSELYDPKRVPKVEVGIPIVAEV